MGKRAKKSLIGRDELATMLDRRAARYDAVVSPLPAYGRNAR